MRTEIVGFLGVLTVAALLGILVGRQQAHMFDEDIQAIVEMSPEAGDRLAEMTSEARWASARRLVTHALALGCLVAGGIALWQRAAHLKQRANAEHWKGLYDEASGQQRLLQTELREHGPHVVRHSRDKTYSALCARCGCLLTQRFKTRAEAAEDRARTETEGCLACPSEAHPPDASPTASGAGPPDTPA